MTIVSEIEVPVCKTCQYWGPDKYNLHEACQLSGIPCGELFSCNKYEPDPRRSRERLQPSS